MNDLSGKNFIASYSGGKDSVLAIYRAMNAGLSPASLITAYNTAADKSWFHGTRENLLYEAADSMAIPLTLIKTTGEQYEVNFERSLSDAKKQGAEVCVFGDIDIEGHRKWCTERCENTGLIPYFPLWGENREKLVYEFIDAGFQAIITVINTKLMEKRFLGETLSADTADLIKKSGADICGENGEYHTFVTDGPIFKKNVDFKINNTIERDGYVILDLQ